jgi:signal transduction histidine kinase
MNNKTVIPNDLFFQTDKQMKKVKRFFNKRLHNFKAKLKIFVPILLIIVFSVSAMTFFSVYLSKKNIYDSIENYLSLEVQSLMKMFEREYELKTEHAQKNLRISKELFYQKGFQISKEKIKFSIFNDKGKYLEDIEVRKWFLNKKELHYNYDFVDKIKSTLGCQATVFQKTEKGFIRISTNVTNNDGNRAVGTFIGFDSPNYSGISNAFYDGKDFFGRLPVVNEYYITGYSAIRDEEGEIVGMLFVGSKEKDLPELASKFRELKIGKSGYPFVFDGSAKMVINHNDRGYDWENMSIIKTIMSEKEELLKDQSHVKRFVSEVDNEEKIIAYDYFRDFDFYICAAVNESEETADLIRNLILASLLLSLLVVLVISVIVYFVTIERFHGYLQALETRDLELATMQDALKHSEKLATMGQLSAGIAHEVNNPLGVVLMYSNILKDECDPDSEIYKDLETIATQAGRCKTILSGLLNFARKNEVNKTKVRLDSFFDNLKRSVILPKTVNLLITHEDPAFEVPMDESQMIQVFVNFINNSVDAMKSNGEIRISTGIDKQAVIFIHEDNGPGITEENQKKLFEPFFSTKQMGKGTGLGLAVVYGIIKMHRGKIIVESNADKSKGNTFARFIVTLPKNPE